MALIHSSLMLVYLLFRIQVVTGLHTTPSVFNTFWFMFFGFQRLHPWYLPRNWPREMGCLWVLCLRLSCGRLTAKTSIGFPGYIGAVFCTAFDGLSHLVDPSRYSHASVANTSGSSLRAVSHPEILKKIKQSILVKSFVRRYVHSLKAYEWNNFKFK
jgi:hypothetical protein